MSFPTPASEFGFNEGSGSTASSTMGGFTLTATSPGSAWGSGGAIGEFTGVIGPVAADWTIAFDVFVNTYPTSGNYSSIVVLESADLWFEYNSVGIFDAFLSGLDGGAAVPSPIGTGVLRNIAVSHASGTNQTKIYVDGTLVTTKNHSSPIGNGFSSSARVNSDGGDGQVMDGRVDNLRLWNSVLTQAEVAEAASTIVGAAGNVNIWDGVKWFASPMRVWNGSGWVAATAQSLGPPAPLFVGNYETGDFSQWAIVQNVNYNSAASGWNGSSYPLQLSTTTVRQGTYSARFELRDGDIPFGGTERTEIQGADPLTGGVEGDVRWYKWSTMIDNTFPDNHASQGWGTITQWHSDASIGSPPVSINVDQLDGYISLIMTPQSAPDVYLGTIVLWSTPYAKGTWHDFKMRILWSPSDSVGSVQFWHNGSRVTFTGGPNSGSDTTIARTMIPGTTSMYFKQGIYREAVVTGTAVVYHDGYTVAASEAALDT